MTNAQIADTLELMADLLEFDGANGFRVRAYRNSARAIRDLSETVASIVEEDPKRLVAIPGVGKSVAEKCIVLVETGELPQLNELLESIPQTVLAMLRIPGLGPKKAAVLYHELNISTLEQLKAACEEEQVRLLKGFGAKSEETILKGIAVAEIANQRILWAKADLIANALRSHMADCESIEQLELAGSYRRKRETVGDLDLLVVSNDDRAVMDRFATFEGIADVIVRGETKMSVRMTTGLQIDLRVVPVESFGAALQYFTGSKDHNVYLRGLAKQRGLKINEYGVFRLDGDEETYVAGATEEDVYATLDLPEFAPELRENRQEFVWAQQGCLPELITEADIVGDLHMHTTATDGKATIMEMVEAAKARGLKYVAITDHSKRVSMAFGLDAERLLQQWQEIDSLNQQEFAGEDFTIVKGIECDILENGEMDLEDDVLAKADWVLASIHYGQQQSPEKITSRIIAAIENPHVSAIAHPTGRLINRRGAYTFDFNAVIDKARENQKVFELNASPRRLDLDDVHCAAAKAAGIPIVINTDAHNIKELRSMRYGVLQARRAGLTKADVLNTRSWQEVRDYLESG